MAIVGGVNTIRAPGAHISFVKAGMLAEDGPVQDVFGAGATGTCRGEGVGMLVLKKLSAAERDGDHIYGLLRGSAENHGGRANSLTAPNAKAQAEVIRDALPAGGDGSAHGRATSRRMERGRAWAIRSRSTGLKRAFEELYGGAAVERAHCGLGSVKTNIGHLELAAGVAGVIKVLLQMQHKAIGEDAACRGSEPVHRVGGESVLSGAREPADGRRSGISRDELA